MDDFKKLLLYRDYYSYQKDVEAIRIESGPKSEDATNAYSTAIKKYALDGDDKWKLDIALDCIKNMKDAEIEHIKSNYGIDEYHFRYGMYVRNHYIHSSRFHFAFNPDEVSSEVEGFIYTIIIPTYNCLSKEFMILVKDYSFGKILKQYRNTHIIVEQMLLCLANNDTHMSAKEALRIIVDTIREELGKDGFKKTIMPLVEEHISKYKYVHIEWKEFMDKLYSITCVYRKEYNQLNAIKDIGVISSISSPYALLKNIDDTCEFIKENLGLSEEDAYQMADCAFSIVKTQTEFNT